MNGREAIQYLKSRREYFGTSFSHLGRNIGISGQYITYIESGEVGTTVNILEAYAKFFAIDVFYLIHKPDWQANIFPSITNFGKRLKNVRKEKDLTLIDLERKIKIHSSTLSRIEMRRSNINFQTLEKIAEGLNAEQIGLYDCVLKKYVLNLESNSPVN